MPLTNPGGSKIVRIPTGTPNAGNTIIYNTSNNASYSDPGFASGSFFGSFTGSLTGNRTYTFPDLSGAIALQSTNYLFKFNSSNVSLRNIGDTADINFTANLINISGDSFVLNSNAIGSGADYSITFNRPASGMSANYALIWPTGLGTTNQALILADAATGQLGWSTPSGGSGTPESIAATPDTLVLRDGSASITAAGGIFNGGIDSTSTTTGDVRVTGGVGVGGRISANNIVLTAGITATTFNGYTPENAANKSTSTTLGTSNTLYPSQNAVKTYVDTYNINTQTVTSYTITTTDPGRLIRFNTASNVNVTVPPDTTSIAIGSHVTLCNSNTGVVTVVAGSGVTVSVASGVNLTLNQHQVGRVIKIAANTWVFSPFFFNSILVEDPYLSLVQLLVHGSSITDISSKNRTITNSGAVISTAQRKFVNSASSIYFDGADTISCASSADFGFSSGDFTVEFWLYYVGISGTDARLVSFGTTANNLNFTLRSSPNGLGIVNESVSHILATGIFPDTNAWNHLAFSRASGVCRLFKNGTQIGSVSSSLGNSSGNFLGFQSVQGYVEELRVTKGLARYTANFTPPQGLFLDS